MSKEIAKKQLDYAWSLYEKGLRGESLEAKTKQFAKDEHLPKVFIPAMHCIAVYVRDNPSVSQVYALKGMLLAVEFSPVSKGLQHHVVRVCAWKAGLANSREEAADQRMLVRANEILNRGNVQGPSIENEAPGQQKRPVINAAFPKRIQGGGDYPAPPGAKEQKRKKLIALLRNLTPEMKAKLKEEKAKSVELEKPDFIWHFILQSFSTMGNSRGYQGLILNRENYNKVTFEALSKLGKKERLDRLNRVFSAALLRMSVTKARWANENYDLIVSMGGLAKSKQLALSQRGTRAKIAFMKQFHGIGDKYARNIWMDVYHPDFRDNIAVDDRIKKISEALGYSFGSGDYEEHEDFYLQIAKEVDLEGWEVDRLLYNFQSIILDSLIRV